MTTTHSPHFVHVADAVEPTEGINLFPYMLGYVDGHWPSAEAMRERFPDAQVVTCATRSSSRAAVLDVEAGDADELDAVRWLTRMRAFGMPRPCLYVQLSSVPSLVDVLATHGQPRASYRLWTAHWTGRAHLCSHELCGAPLVAAGATQYAGAAQGHPWDTSLSTDGWMRSMVNASTELLEA